MKRSSFLALLAFVLILSLSIGSAMAYFSDTDNTDGKQTITFGAETTITEKVDGLKKTITISNSENSKVAVFVRVRAFSTHTINGEGSGWTKRGDYWYYNTPLEPGPDPTTRETSDLIVSIERKPVPVDEDDSFNVIVVYEAVPAMYKEDGTPQPSTYDAAWQQKITTG